MFLIFVLIIGIDMHITKLFIPQNLVSETVSVSDFNSSMIIPIHLRGEYGQVHPSYAWMFQYIYWMYKETEEVFYTFYPNGEIPVENIPTLGDEVEPRWPQSYSVDLKITVVDYDSHRHKVLIYEITRKKWETEDEVCRRLHSEFPKIEIPVDTSNQVISMFESKTVFNSGIFNMPEELKA